jgi:hypothetical protein
VSYCNNNRLRSMMMNIYIYIAPHPVDGWGPQLITNNSIWMKVDAFLCWNGRIILMCEQNILYIYILRCHHYDWDRIYTPKGSIGSPLLGYNILLPVLCVLHYRVIYFRHSFNSHAEGGCWVTQQDDLRSSDIIIVPKFWWSHVTNGTKMHA